MSRVISLVAIALVLAATFAYACSWGNPVWPKSGKSDTPLFRFVVGLDKNARAGYIKANGEIVIPPTFQAEGNYGNDDFFDGIALVREQGHYWYVNAKGEKLFRKSATSPFSEGLATFEESGKSGYLDKQGKVAITPSFEAAESFSEDLAAAEIDHRYGYIDRSGSFVIKPGFVLALPFRNGVARVVKRSGCLYIGYGPCDFFNPRLLPSILKRFEQPTMKEPPCTYSFIDKAGHDLFAAEYRDAKDFSEGLAPVGDGQSWGFVDSNGRLSIRLHYQNAEPFAEGLAAVMIGNKWGYVNRAGKLVIPTTFLNAAIIF